MNLIRLILLLICCTGHALAQTPFADRGEAEKGMAEMALSPLEGIWEYPADEIALTVLKDSGQRGRYEIRLLESVDCRLAPGQAVGWIEESADPSKFRISLCSAVSDGLPGQEKVGMATLSEHGDVLKIEMPKVRLRLTPSIIFPSLWNALRLGLRVNTSNPLEKLPEGWIKTYPETPGHLSRIRYL